MKILEDKLQEEIIKQLESNEFLSGIEGQDRIDQVLKKDHFDNFMPSFLVDFKLHEEYARSAKLVLDALNSYKIITGKSIKNISLEPNSPYTNEILKPDIVLYNEETNQIIIFELKRSKQAERQAITELTAYMHEVRNHLPFSSDIDILLVIISTEYNTLLNHAIGSLILNSTTNLMCLFAEPTNEEKVKLTIHFPSTAWTDIGQDFLPKNALITKPFHFRPKNGISHSLDTELHQMIMSVTNEVMHTAIKLNTHGFYFITQRTTESEEVYGITICLLNPYAFLSLAQKGNFSLRTDEPLAKYLLANQMGDDVITETKAFELLSDTVKKSLSLNHEIIEGDLKTWVAHWKSEDFRREIRPLEFNSWGAIGDYIRYFSQHPATNILYMSQSEKDNTKGYRDPFIGLQSINLMSGNYLFKDGHFNASDVYKFCKLMINYRQLCYEKYLGSKVSDPITTLSYYYALEITAALKEITIRLLSVGDDEIRKCPRMPIFAVEVDTDITGEIDDFMYWFNNIFTKESAIIHKFYIHACFSAAQYSRYRLIESSSEEELRPLKEEVLSFMRERLEEYLLTISESKAEYSDEVINKVEKLYSKIQTAGNDGSEGSKSIDSLEELSLIDAFEADFIYIADEFIDEIFHQIPFMTESIRVMDWQGLKEKILTRTRRGDKYVGLILTTDGMIGVTTLTKQQYSVVSEIMDYEKNLYFINQLAGLELIMIEKWEDIFSGVAFEKWQKMNISNP